MSKALFAGVSSLLIILASLGLTASNNAYAGGNTTGMDDMAVPLQPVENTESFPTETRPGHPLSSVTELQNGEVEQRILPAPKDSLLLSVKNSDLEGHSRLKARAIAITLKNVQGVPIRVLDGQVINGMDEVSLIEAKPPAQELKQQAMNFLSRGSGVVSGFGILGASSYGTSAGMVPPPSMGNGSNDTQTAKEVVTGHFINQIRDVNINPDQSYTFKALIPVGTAPKFKLVFKNLSTNQVYHL